MAQAAVQSGMAAWAVHRQLARLASALVLDAQPRPRIEATLEAPTACITDNKAACDVIKYPGATKRTLHFDRWLHFAREMCLHNRIEIFLTGTDNMMGDGFTKPVDKTKFLKCRDYILTKA